MFVTLLDGAYTQRLAGNAAVPFGAALRDREYVPRDHLGEERAVLDLHAKHTSPTAEGEPWYVVCAEWWGRWTDHVNFWQHAEMPGPIDNEPLLLPDSQGGSGRELRRTPALKETEDYVTGRFG